MSGNHQIQSTWRITKGTMFVNSLRHLISFLEKAIHKLWALITSLGKVAWFFFPLPVQNVVELVKPPDFPFPAPLEEGLPYDIYSTFIAQLQRAEEETKVRGGFFLIKPSFVKYFVFLDHKINTTNKAIITLLQSSLSWNLNANKPLLFSGHMAVFFFQRPDRNFKV